MNNLNELNKIANAIRNNEKAIADTNYEEVRQYVIKRYNEAIEIIEGVKDFVENNIDLFENGKGGWEKRDTRATCFGFMNPYNCVYRHDKTYWVDNGINFSIEEGKVTTLSYMRTFVEGHRTCYFEAESFPVFTDSNGKAIATLGSDSFKDINEFSAERLKNTADKMFAMANTLVEKLMFSVKAINESVNMRLNGIVQLKDSAATCKTTKYVFEVTKVEG